MDTWVWIVIAAAAAVVVLAVLGLAISQRRRTQRTERLRRRFGPEYERAADEDELESRLERRERLQLRPLSDTSRRRYESEWHDVQARFVDEPTSTIREAHRLVSQLLAERGYPTEHFEQQAADLSVDHPVVVERYRAAHAVYEAHDAGEVPLERQRQALVDYRALFAELLEPERETARA